MATTLGYIEGLIKHIDSGRKIWHTIGMKSHQHMSWTKVDPNIANILARSPKFTLPTLGQFYRPLEELQENERKKYPFYIESFELDMLQYPPYDCFILEFKGHDEQVQISSSMLGEKQMERFVMICRSVEFDGRKGIAIKVFYFNENSNPLIGQLGRLVSPIGWSTNGVEYAQMWQPADKRLIHPYYPKSHSVALRVIEPAPAYPIPELIQFASSLWPEFRALHQFLVVMNVKKGVSHSQVTTPKSKNVTLAGRRLGYEYHVLSIDPEYVAETISGGGTHASPRYHIRRAHLRHYSDGKVTFIKQMNVGNPLLGSVAKDYVIKGKE